MSEPARSAAMTAQLLASCKADVWRLLQRMPGTDTAAALREQVAPDAEWHVFHPINELAGTNAVIDGLYGPLQAAFPDLERRTDLFFAGEWISPAEGAFYLYADISDRTNDSQEFCARMLAEAGIAASPGVDFDRRRGHHFMRFSYCGPEADMAEAAERLRKWK